MDAQLRWLPDGRLYPERYATRDEPTPTVCDDVGDRCGSRWCYERLGCRGDRCRDTQRDRKRGVDVTRGWVELPQRTTCARGHQRTPATTYTRPDGRRECRVCRDLYRYQAAFDSNTPR